MDRRSFFRAMPAVAVIPALAVIGPIKEAKARFIEQPITKIIRMPVDCDPSSCAFEDAIARIIEYTGKAQPAYRLTVGYWWLENAKRAVNECFTPHGTVIEVALDSKREGNSPWRLEGGGVMVWSPIA